MPGNIYEVILSKSWLLYRNTERHSGNSFDIQLVLEGGSSWKWSLHPTGKYITSVWPFFSTGEDDKELDYDSRYIHPKACQHNLTGNAATREI